MAKWSENKLIIIIIIIVITAIATSPLLHHTFFYFIFYHLYYLFIWWLFYWIDSISMTSSSQFSMNSSLKSIPHPISRAPTFNSSLQTIVTPLALLDDRQKKCLKITPKLPFETDFVCQSAVMPPLSLLPPTTVHHLLLLLKLQIPTNFHLPQASQPKIMTKWATKTVKIVNYHSRQHK